MCHLDGRNHSSDELSGSMSNTYDIGSSSAQTSSRYNSAPSMDNYQGSRQYGG